jgi:hypothetical protein
MTVDHKEISIMPGTKERNLVPNIPGFPIDSPFPNGRLLVAGRNTEWDIRNDGVLITFTDTHDPNQVGDTYDPLSLRGRIEDLVEESPVLGNIFTFDRIHIHRRKDYKMLPRIFTLPTLATLNEFSQDVFQGLDTAKIQLVQSHPENEKPDGEAPVELYVDELLHGRLVVSSQPTPNPDGYIHDIMSHGIGAMTIEKSEMDIFQALCKEKDNIGGLYGDAIKGSYTARLGDAYDLYTAYIASPPPLDKYLPDTCLKRLSYDLSHLHGDRIATILPEAILKKSQEIVERYSTADDNSRRAEHYDKINQRLKQPPWTPRGYVLPLR